MEVRLTSRDKFYDTLVEWWGDWGFPILAKESLPVNIFVVNKNDTDLYAAPLYLTDSDICWLAFITSNFKASKELKEGALDYLLEDVEKFMTYNNYNNIVSISNTPRIENSLQNSGYLLPNGEEKVNFYLKHI